MDEPYVLYGGELSLFTRKLEAALNIYGAAFEFRNKADADPALIETRSGTHQVPVLQTPENWMLADTTPIMMLLDARFPARRQFPDGEMGLLVHVLEEFFDEWIARVMVHYRWHYEESAVFASERISGGNAEAAARIRGWGPRACRATGTESEHQQAEVEAEYARMLAAAETQLQQTAYLLGDRPTALDCMFLGGLWAHTNMDPVPKRVVANYPTVLHWAETRATQWDGGGELAAFAEPTPFALTVLAEMADTYGRFVLGNADALHVGAKAFHVDTYGEETSYLTRPYPEQSRRMVAKRVAALDTEEVRSWLNEYNLLHVFNG